MVPAQVVPSSKPIGGHTLHTFHVRTDRCRDTWCGTSCHHQPKRSWDLQAGSKPTSLQSVDFCCLRQQTSVYSMLKCLVLSEAWQAVC